jgi:hypothetical protein
MGATVRTAGLGALAAIMIVFIFAPSDRHRVRDPNEPIAANGSLIAGRAHTIYDTEPSLGAFKETRPNSDDPDDFEPLIKTERQFAERDRSLFKSLLGRLDWSLCRGGDRQMLTLAVRTYYEERGRLISQFSHRGPRAQAAIEREWSTPDDRQIDDYVRHTLQYGILHKSDFPAKSYPEFASLFSDTQELGVGCTAADR